jgi:hypothetical protein
MRQAMKSMGTIAGSMWFFVAILSVDAATKNSPKSSAEPHFNLGKVVTKSCMSKGRVQDREYNQSKEVDQIVQAREAAIPPLIRLLTDTHRTKRPLECHWSETRIGDMAFIVLSDLFTDSHYNSTVPELTWDEFLESARPDIAAESKLRGFINIHGRSGLKEKWKTFWEKHQNDLVWDERELCFRLLKSDQ